MATQLLAIVKLRYLIFQPCTYKMNVYLSKLLLLLLVVFSLDGFSQSNLIPMIYVNGNPQVYIQDINIVSDKVFLVDGLYTGDVLLGKDTLRSSMENPKRFVSQLKNETLQRSMVSDGVVLGVTKNAFCVVGDGNSFHGKSISKFNLKNELIWKYNLLLSDSSSHMVAVADICFDDEGNTYMLFTADVHGVVRLGNDKVTGPSTFVAKIGIAGNLVSYRKIADKYYCYNRMLIKDDKVCAYSTNQFYPAACVLDMNLSEEIQDKNLVQFCKYKVWDKTSYYRMIEAGKRPERLFLVEKYNAKEKDFVRNEVFRDTLRFQDEIYQYELFDFSKTEIVVVYISRGIITPGPRCNQYVNVLKIRKKNLAISERTVIECDWLRGNDDVVFSLSGSYLYIGHEYNPSRKLKIGNLEFVDNTNGTASKSFFIVKLPLK
ncbi:hypothetical protein SAMN05660236_0527 [Ohtaekwangia koreensis]|uniref:Uncharacterized protein n=2 Tax=Ohtaekwangia koreensis TaxID=688867 RepID=A0A1T5IXT2_9BACT|nr:hypothetical protein SAMN05660236_0527 [Ohtaekwangia koreensis]